MIVLVHVFAFCVTRVDILESNIEHNDEDDFLDIYQKEIVSTTQKRQKEIRK